MISQGRNGTSQSKVADMYITAENLQIERKFIEFIQYQWIPKQTTMVPSEYLPCLRSKFWQAALIHVELWHKSFFDYDHHIKKQRLKFVLNWEEQRDTEKYVQLNKIKEKSLLFTKVDFQYSGVAKVDFNRLRQLFEYSSLMQ